MKKDRLLVYECYFKKLHCFYDDINIKKSDDINIKKS